MTSLTQQDLLGILCYLYPPVDDGRGACRDDGRLAEGDADTKDTDLMVPPLSWATHIASLLYYITGTLHSPTTVQEQFMILWRSPSYGMSLTALQMHHGELYRTHVATCGRLDGLRIGGDDTLQCSSRRLPVDPTCCNTTHDATCNPDMSRDSVKIGMGCHDEDPTSPRHSQRLTSHMKSTMAAAAVGELQYQRNPSPSPGRSSEPHSQPQSQGLSRGRPSMSHPSPDRGNANDRTGNTAISRSSDGRDAALATPRAAAAAAPASGVREEPQDTIDGLWAFPRSVAEHSRLRRLRYETPLSPEVLSSLIQRFSLVEGADVFFAPVPVGTIMEYNEVRSGPYDGVIRAPLSLMLMKSLVGDSRRYYHMFSHHQQRNISATKNPPTAGGGLLANALSGSASTLRVGEADETDGAVSTLCTHSRPDQLLTLAELERAVWQIAANCAMFNAPESFYPITARRFALSCTALLANYCQSQLATF